MATNKDILKKASDFEEKYGVDPDSIIISSETEDSIVSMEKEYTLAELEEEIIELKDEIKELNEDNEAMEKSIKGNSNYFQVGELRSDIVDNNRKLFLLNQKLAVLQEKSSRLNNIIKR